MLTNYPNQFGFSVSYTTRKPRGEERHGREYFFVEKETFEREIYNKKFLEYNEVYGNYYGTHRDTVEAIIKSGFRDMRNNGLLVYNSMFVMPPSIEILRKRLEVRGTDTPEAIDKRISHANREIEMALSLGIFDVIVKNADREEFLKICTEKIYTWYPFLK